MLVQLTDVVLQMTSQNREVSLDPSAESQHHYCFLLA